MPEFLTEVVSPEREFDRGFKKSELIAGIVACSFEHVGVDGLLVEKKADGVRQLDFAASASSSVLEDAENLWCENVTADDCKV